MYVEEIILEGFKTYMNRTVISGFDPQFNAITGLNGSGKSNILDAIQFLLGSTSKEMLRLKSGLTELIYKQGFAGIEKASVTIKFRCFDKQLRPTGYENCQELVITRQITRDKITKFFINGTSSNLSKVRNMFRSVQLNIQNPHFLIKQGQITKIINLKPLQILSMIQQTAGTAYYNKTKIESEKIIQKKQQKLKAINEILTSSIEPQMQKLDADRRRYIAYKDKQGLLQHLNQKIKIFEYTIKARQMKQKQNDVSTHRQTINFKKQQWKINAERYEQLDGQIKLLTSKANSSVINHFNKVKGLLLEKQDQKNQIKGRNKKLNEEVIKIKQQNNQYQEELENRKKEIEWQQKVVIQTDKQKQEIQSLLSQFNTANSQKDANTIIEKQISQENNQMESLNAEIKLLNSKKESIQREVENEKKVNAQILENNNNINKNLQDLQKQIISIENMKAPESIPDPDLEHITLRDLENSKKRILSQSYQLNFFYNDPHTNFDRSKVKGKMFMLFKAKNKAHLKALQIGVGGRLNNVVVENEIISKQMIERQCFGKNVTVIPNNKIRFKSIKRQTIEEAARIANDVGGLAKPAYELIDYSKEIENSIMFAFSNFIICSSQQIAKRIAYHSNKYLSCKCVTYDGDIFQYGTLTGGHFNQTLILPQYDQLLQIEAKIKEEKLKYEVLKKNYDEYQKKSNEYRYKQKQLENKIAKKDKIKNKLLNYTLNIKKKNFSFQKEDIDKKIKELTKDKEQLLSKLDNLKATLKGKKTTSMKEQRQSLEKQLKKHNTKISQAQRTISKLEIRIEELKLNINHKITEQGDLEKQIIELERLERQLITNLRQYQTQYERVEQQKMKIEKENIINQAKHKSLTNERNEIKSNQDNFANAITNLESLLEASKKEIHEIQKYLNKILEENMWLDPDREYDIPHGFNYESSKNQYKLLQLEVDKLKKNAKMNIDDHSYQKLNEQYKNLLEKRHTLQKDKITLLTNMQDLDDKRTKTLEKCFDSVKTNLTKIFSDLLPGAAAHINLIDSSDVTKGAELSVHFNKVKKELSELSGGQRSLLALSFILALLLYKPSPFYILDEIDSALDLSHTENIGYMISQRFPQSQFIIISLKQGMFHNSNVLYKVQFSEGQSKVERQTIKKK